MVSDELKQELVKKFGSLANVRKHFRTKWLAALESGKYKQTKGTLRQPKGDGKSYGYCCLGVLCNLAVNDGVGEWTKLTPDGKPRSYKLDGERNDSMPVTQFLDLVGISPEMGDRLATMNDHEGKSFTDIAKHLRKLWRKR